ncbi:hypothetical protein GY45DRAFT_1329149 [Cubamyces sp. BRFM 1775]|nr:hypothetical protein GY45DRAFT_1329149 [Cubamyces sp. BRFM 1775]
MGYAGPLRNINGGASPGPVAKRLICGGISGLVYCGCGMWSSRYMFGMLLPSFT